MSFKTKTFCLSTNVVAICLLSLLECNTLYPDKCAVRKHGAAGRQFTDGVPPDADLPSGGIRWITGGPNSLHKICSHAAVLQNVKRTRTKQRYVCMYVGWAVEECVTA